jgi:hypothetical protein
LTARGLGPCKPDIIVVVVVVVVGVVVVVVGCREDAGTRQQSGLLIEC